MSIWQELYEIFDRERARWQAKSTQKQALVYEIRRNLTFLADALTSDVSEADMANGLERAVFEAALKNGLVLNSICDRTLWAKTIGSFDEFKVYVGKDTAYLITNAYLKIDALLKLVKSAKDKSYSLKFKSLFRFLMLVVAHLEGQQLVRRKKS